MIDHVCCAERELSVETRGLVELKQRRPRMSRLPGEIQWEMRHN